MDEATVLKSKLMSTRYRATYFWNKFAVFSFII